MVINQKQSQLNHGKILFPVSQLNHTYRMFTIAEILMTVIDARIGSILAIENIESLN